MNSYSLFHVSDTALLRGLAALVKQDRATTAQLLAHISEVEERRLYAPAGYPSMFAYCVHELRFSEDVACRHLQVARLARRFPVVFEMLADGRLHVTGASLVARYAKARPETAPDLIAAAEGRTKTQIERMLAERFPCEDVPTQIRALGIPNASNPPAPVRVISGLDLESDASPGTTPNRESATVEPVPGAATSAEPAASGTQNPALKHAPGDTEPVDSPAPVRVEGPAERSRIKPLAPERYAVQFTMGQAMHEKLEYARALLSHEMPSGNIPEILERALDSLISSLEKRKFAAVSKPRKTSGRRSSSARRVPAAIKNAVWKRDKGRCTFVSESGHRCESRSLLEYDHVIPVAKGGRASLENLRLRCRAHNQYEASRAFGHGFMHEKRERARHEAQGQARKAPVAPG